MALFGELCELDAATRSERLTALAAEDAALARELGDLLEADDAENDTALFGSSPDSLARDAAVDLLAGDDVAVDELLSGPEAASGGWPAADSLRLPGFRIIERRGSGGSGAVYRARRSEARDEDVAIKLLAPSAVANPRAVERFRREFAAIAQLDHPRCLKVFEQGQQGSFHYFVMEYVARDLTSLVGAPLGTCVEAGRQIAGALDHLHSRGLVHRDLKPSNVLVASVEPLEIKLADFGIARGGGLAQITEAGQVLGTLGYLAPELLRQQHQQENSASLDPRVDLYALGCLLFELMGGELPFRVPWELRDPPDEKRHLRRLAPQVPEALDALLYELLAPTAEGRPGSAATVLARLETL